ncbi:hypothetical protein [Streptomyces sp. NPDC055243]|uniref:hypothetical protein n=1 Tax=Streptomyces sp. NPDC055243 TaxID=3365720 RepID=UPI0037D12A83
MPAYLIIHAERRGDDTLIEDPKLTLQFTDGWVIFKDHTPFGEHDLTGGTHVVLAIPAAQVLRVERVDEGPEPEDQKPAPNEE